MKHSPAASSVTTPFVTVQFPTDPGSTLRLGVAPDAEVTESGMAVPTTAEVGFGENFMESTP